MAHLDGIQERPVEIVHDILNMIHIDPTLVLRGQFDDIAGKELRFHIGVIVDPDTVSGTISIRDINDALSSGECRYPIIRPYAESQDPNYMEETYGPEEDSFSYGVGVAICSPDDEVTCNFVLFFC
jgi:hypothetical protein